MTTKFRSRLELHTVVGTNARHILAAAAEVCVRETLNGQYYVTFTYPRLPDDNERYETLIERNQIRFPTDIIDKGVAGQTFVIKRVDEERRGLRIFKRIEAHHVAFELNRYFLDDYVDFAANKEPAYLLAKLGNNTPFTMAVEGSFDNQDVFDFGEKRKHTLLDEVRTLYDGELAYNNYNITLTTRAGGNYGSTVRYRKNLAGITRKSHEMERVTRLYGYGKAGLTIEGYGGHTVKYIDSTYIDPAHIYEDSVDFPDIDDQAALLAAMQRHLATVELPKVSYEIDFVQLEKVDAEFTAEAIRGVGDTVTVKDESLGYHFDARVVYYERYPFEPKKARVTLANFRELSVSDYVWQASVGSKRAMIYTSENAVLRGIKYDDSITLVDGYGMAVSDELNRVRVRLGQTGPGEYGLAAYNKAGAKTIWLDATTGDGRFSGKIVAGEIEGGTITGATINGTTINGGSINGSTLIGGTISTRLTYPRIELSSAGNLLSAYYDANNYVGIMPYLLNGPAFAAYYNSYVSGTLSAFNNHTLLYGMAGNLMVQSNFNVEIQPGNGYRAKVDSWNILYSNSNSQTLQQALDSKVNVGGQTLSHTQPNHNHGIPAGTRLAVLNSNNEISGAVFWSESGGFTHYHVI